MGQGLDIQGAKRNQAAPLLRIHISITTMDSKSHMMFRNNWQSIASSRSLGTRACLREYGTTKPQLRELATNSEFQGSLYLEVAEDKFEPMVIDDVSYVHSDLHTIHVLEILGVGTRQQTFLSSTRALKLIFDSTRNTRFGGHS